MTYNYGFPGGSVNTGTVNLGVEGVMAQGCPPNAVEINGICQCATGYKPEGNSCVPVQCPPGGSYSKTTQPDQLVGAVGAVCQGGCSAMPSSYEFAPDGKIYAQWPFRYTGSTCAGQTDAAGVDNNGDKGFEDPPTPCGPGLCPGTVNGQSVCVPCTGGQTTPGTKETAPKPVEPTQPGVDGVPGAQTKETSTSCTGANCTTTTTYKDKDGNTVGTGTKEEPKESFCQENPGISICKIGSFGGGCAAGSGSFNCDGDAVQCAIALEQHRRACEWSYIDPALKAKGDDAIAGGDRPGDHPFKNAQETTFSLSSTIDTTNRLAGGCPGDESISVAGRSFVIPWSRACGSLEMLGNIVVGFAMLAAAGIVFRG
jgi:hypothetical protein